VETHEFGVYEPADSPEAWANVAHLARGPENGALVVDSISASVSLVIPGTGVVRHYGTGVGQGPGELQDPVAAAWDGRMAVYIADRYNPRLSKFSLDGEFLSYLTVSGAPYRFCFDEEGVLWTSSLFAANSDEVRRIDRESGNVLSVQGGRYEGEAWDDHTVAGATIAVFGGGVLVSNGYPYEIRQFNASGQLVRIIGRELAWLKAPEKDSAAPPNAVWMPRNGYIFGAEGTTSGRIIVLLQQLRQPDPDTRTIESLLDLFGKDGSWLMTIPLSDVFHGRSVGRWMVASDGALWILWNGDYPRISRIEINWKLSVQGFQRAGEPNKAIELGRPPGSSPRPLASLTHYSQHLPPATGPVILLV
jgi:hypothetical protein